MKRSRLTAIAFAGLLPLAGCANIKTPAVAFSDDGEYLPGEVGDGLVVAPNSLIPDVPMPIGFRAVASQSNWRYDGRVRVVHHVYQGQANQGDGVEFYQRVLPGNGWELVDMQAVGNATLMRYTKGPERLSVSSEYSWGVTTITIDIEPR